MEALITFFSLSLFWSASYMYLEQLDKVNFYSAKIIEQYSPRKVKVWICGLDIVKTIKLKKDVHGTGSYYTFSASNAELYFYDRYICYFPFLTLITGLIFKGLS